MEKTLDCLPPSSGRTSASGPRPPLCEKSGRPIGMSTATVASAGSASSKAAKLGKTATDGAAPGSRRTAIQPALQPSTPTSTPFRKCHARLVPPRMQEVAKLHHRHRMRQALRVGFELQFVAAALGRARQDLVDRRRGRLQRLDRRLSRQDAGQIDGRRQVAEPVRRLVDEAVFGQQRLAAVEQQIAGAARHHRRRRGHQHGRGPA